MGAGKTTVGRALAKKLNKRFVDSDHEIEARSGALIPWIFEIEGEASFRRREAEVIRDLTAEQGIVLATGGGAVLDAQNRAYLHARGTVVYLRTSVQNILQRTGHDKNRPLLQTADPRKLLEELTRQRDPLYREIAHVVIDTGRPNVQFMVHAILHHLGLTVPNVQSEQSEQSARSCALDEPQHKRQHMNTLQHPSMQLKVDLGNRSYPIIIGQSLLTDSILLARHIQGQRVAVVTNTTVASLYLEPFVQTLRAAGKEVMTIILPDGEEYKNWASLMQIFDALLGAKCDRKTTLIALGGGVIGDLTGFAASSYMRGIPFVQVPTTLLAQVDSAVGGKTGINHPLGKNMIGAFYQPQAVISDTSTLATLPARELAAGLAEIIKMAAIIDAPFFNWIESNIAKLVARDTATITAAIHRSCEIKADVVRQDEREGGLRAILNFGHTFAHAIESGLGYGKWLHGEAVGCGMVMAADLSYRLGLIDYVTKVRVNALVQAAGLPTVAPDLGTARWLELMEVDKKNEGGQIKFILLKPLGKPVIMSAPQDILLATLQAAIH